MTLFSSPNHLQTNKMSLIDDTTEFLILLGSIYDDIEVMFKVEVPVF